MHGSTIYLEKNINRAEFNFNEAATAIQNAGVNETFTVSGIIYEDESALVRYITEEGYHDVRFKQA